MKDVAAIVVNWNGGAAAVDAVGSIASQSARPDVWVIDNGSDDGSCDAIATACPSAHVIRNARNTGFAAAVNQGLAAAGEARFVLLANNDIVLRDADALARVIAFMDAHPDVNGACGRYEFPDGTFQRFYSQLPTEFDMEVMWGVGRHLRWLLFSRRARAYYLVDRDFTRPMTIEQPAFSCVVMRRDAMQRVGALDEQFPIFFNDVDYCWRWREHGFTWHYLPDWRVVHDKSRSTTRIPMLSAELAGSAMRFTRKHFRGGARRRICVAILMEVAWRKLRHHDFPAPLRAVWQGRLFHVPAADA